MGTGAPLPPRTQGVIETLEEASLIARDLLRPAQEFIYTEGASGRLLIVAALVGLAWANSPVSDSYEEFWTTTLRIDIGTVEVSHDLREWVNNGLMSLFFFLVTLEVKHELLDGALSSRATAALPVFAAVGGMLLPALVYLAINVTEGEVHGWGIPIATDIAFALAIATLLRDRVPHALLTFLLAFAVVDDIGAIVIIAVFYADSISIQALAIAVGMLVLVVALQRVGLTSITAYVVLGVLLWLAISESGVHGTIAGVLLAAVTPSQARRQVPDFSEVVGELLERYQTAVEEDDRATVEWALGRIETAAHATEPPLQRLMRLTHPWSGFVVLPAFALANSGIDLSPDAISGAVSGRIGAGVVAGLLLGKPLGVLGASWLAVRLGIARLPRSVQWAQMAGIAMLSGIGFTVAIFIAELAFTDDMATEEARLAIFASTVVAALVGLVLLRSVPAPDAPQ